MPTPSSLKATLEAAREKARELNPVIDSENAHTPPAARKYLNSVAIEKENMLLEKQASTKELFDELPRSGGKKKRKSIKKRKTRKKHCQTKYKRKN
jgi:hypothetical protein